MAMAASNPGVKVTECSVCADNYKDPVVLPCGHSFCLVCVQTWAQKTETLEEDVPENLSQPQVESGPSLGRFSCPECREDHEIPQGGVHCFPKNYALLRSGSTDHGKEIQTNVCDSCEKGAGKVWCKICKGWLCQDCEDQHKKTKLSRNHTLIPADQLDKNETIQLKSCSKHSAKPLDIYCVECEELCCITGSVAFHKPHKCLGIEEKLIEVNTNFQNTLDLINSKIAGVKSEQKLVQKLMKETEVKNGKVKQMLEQRKAQIVSHVEKHLSSFIQQIDKDFAASEADFKKKVDELDSAIGEMAKLENQARDFMLLKEPQKLILEHGKEIKKLIEAAQWNPIIVQFTDYSYVEPVSEIGKMVKDMCGTLKKKQIGTEGKPKPFHFQNISVKLDGDHRFCCVTDAAILENGNVAVIDGGNHKIKIFSQYGQCINQSRSRECKDPVSISCIPGKTCEVLVVDSGSQKVSRWNAEHNTITPLVPSGTPTPSNPCGVTLTCHRGQTVAAVADLYSSKIFLFDLNNGTLVDTFHSTVFGPLMPFGSVRSIAGNTKHALILVTRESLSCLNEGGLMVGTSFDVIHPRSALITGSGRVIVAEPGTNSILLLSSRGTCHKKLETLLSEEDGIRNPHVLAYDETNRLLILAEKCSSIIKCYRYII